ncbi:torulene dioxygenase [Alternaria panax]|uniref:Torulene dioxygenase n=1 Tax=Alternaria panax TaxID=48097 RepID=A0AAD4FIB4_9PLEO|nr:torulene dioxygenase [Alternaria panax]
MTDKYAVLVTNASVLIAQTRTKESDLGQCVKQPVVIDTSDPSKTLIESIACEHDSPVYFHVLDKENGRLVASYQVLNFYFFHTANAYDYVDPKTGKTSTSTSMLPVTKRSITLTPSYAISNVINPLKPYQVASLVRYELGAVNTKDPNVVARGTVKAAIPGIMADLPRVSKLISMDPNYRYVYGVSGTVLPLRVLVYRLDVSAMAWRSLTRPFMAISSSRTGRLPIFVQRPGATDEDDGIVITITINKEGTNSVLVGLDGKTFEEVGRAGMPQVYSLGPHGSFVEGNFGLVSTMGRRIV